MTTKYDVFLSYARQDRREGEEIAQRLADVGLRVFFDRWYLAPGRPWPEALEAAMRSCGSVVVVLGAHGLGNWQRREVNLALDRQATDDDLPVIPVLLRGATPSAGFLALNTWIDLSAGVADPGAIDELVAAIRGEPLGARSHGVLDGSHSGVSPYMGLRSFDEQDAPFFHGRWEFTRRLVEAVREKPIIAVVGASGSGKSSVVSAGLIPRLRSGSAEQVWDVVSLVPGDVPMKALAAAVLPLLESDLSETDLLVETGKLGDHLAAGDVSLADVVRRCLQKQPGTDRLLVVIDQWEELYALVPDSAVRARFIDTLLDAVDGSPLTVVLTLRADFFDAALANRRLADRLQDAVVNVSGMTPEELRRAIENPAAQLGARFEPGLVERILADVGTAPGNLPLLEFVLAELWEGRRDGTLLHDVYSAIGGVRGAIAQRADEAVAEMAAESVEVTRRVFLQLVAPSSAGGYTRKAASIDDLGSVADRVVKQLVDARLLVTGRNAVSGLDTVEVAHEALIANWSQLNDWLEQDRDFLDWRQRLGSAHEAWIHAERDRDALLHGLLLGEARHWLTTHAEQLSTEERAFIDASIGNSRRSSRLRSLALVAVSLVALAAGFFAWTAARAADESRILAADALIGDAQYRLSTGQFEEAAIGLAESYRLDPTHGPLASMGQIVNGHEVWGTAIEGAGRSNATLVAVDWRRSVAAVVGEGNVAILDIETGALLGELEVGAKIRGMEFLPGGELVTGDEVGEVLVWNVSAMSNSMIAAMESRIADVAVASQDVVVVATEHAVRSFELEDGEWTPRSDFPLSELDLPEGRRAVVRRLALSGDGGLLAIVGSPLLVSVWDFESAVLIGKDYSETGQAAVWSVVFSPDGRFVLTGRQDRTLRVHDAATLVGDQPTQRVDGQQRSISFSPDGRTVVSSGQGGLLVWQFNREGQLGTSPVSIGRTTTLTTHHHELSPDGSVAVAGLGDRVRLYRVESGTKEAPLPAETFWSVLRTGHVAWVGGDAHIHRWDSTSDQSRSVTMDSSITALAASADGNAVFFGATSGELGVVDTDTFSNTLVQAHDDRIWDIAVSPDRRTVITVGADHKISVRDPISLDELDALPDRVPESGRGFKKVVFLDHARIVTAGVDGFARFWDLESGTESLPPVAIAENQVNAAALSPQGLLVVGDELGDITVVDVDRRVIVTKFPGHTAAVRALALSPDGRTLASGGQDNAVRLWDVTTWSEVGVLRNPGSVRALAYSDDSREITAVDINGNAVVWDAEWWQWPERICEWLDGWSVRRSWESVLGEAPYAPTCDGRTAAQE